MPVPAPSFPAIAIAAAEPPGAAAIVLPLAVLVLVGLAIPAFMLIANAVLSRWANGRRTGSPGKDAPVESGLSATLGGAKERFSVKFYLVAMLFLAFDLEVAFLYPWAAQFVNVPGWSMLWLLLPFLLMIEVGYLYLWKKGALDWEE